MYIGASKRFYLQPKERPLLSPVWAVTKFSVRWFLIATIVVWLVKYVA